MALRQVICALDTGDLDEALSVVRRLSPYVRAFKIGHALTLPWGLEVLERLRGAGAERVFVDLKFHDIPNVVGLAVREACRARAWMITLHIGGGPAMLAAAVEEAKEFGEVDRPLLIGVSVLTSIDEPMLQRLLGCARSLPEQMEALSRMAIDQGLDGVVSSPQEVAHLRNALGRSPVIVTPGIRLSGVPGDDHRRTGNALEALRDGADYLVIGRTLTESPDPAQTLAKLGLMEGAGL